MKFQTLISGSSLSSTELYHTNLFRRNIFLRCADRFFLGYKADIQIYKGKNGFRMPAYHRLDIGLNIKKTKSEWHLGIYNAYNHMNTYYYYFKNKGDKKHFDAKNNVPFITFDFVFLFFLICIQLTGKVILGWLKR